MVNLNTGRTLLEVLTKIQVTYKHLEEAAQSQRKDIIELLRDTAKDLEKEASNLEAEPDINPRAEVALKSMRHVQLAFDQIQITRAQQRGVRQSLQCLGADPEASPLISRPDWVEWDDRDKEWGLRPEIQPGYRATEDAEKELEQLRSAIEWAKEANKQGRVT